MTKIEIINKAIEEGDFILLDGEAVIPRELQLCYYDQDMKKYLCDINNVTIEAYDD
jgi:hypothetical protein